MPAFSAPRRAPARRFALALVALPLLTACSLKIGKGAVTSRTPEFIHPDGPPANPFSPAVRVGNLVFVSGTLGTVGTGMQLVPGGIGPETKQVMENIKRTLGAAGLGMDRLVKCTAFLADLKEWPAMNEVYRSYFPNGKYPARAAVQATLLAGARVELECVAAG